MNNQEVINQFYSSFKNGDPAGMIACYHNTVIFEDPAFGKLEGEKAKAMWQMLLSKKEESEMSVSFSVLNDNQAEWIANYKYGPNKKPVINAVSASFVFEDGKIIKHTDHFDLWKWSKQALGAAGYLLGWSGFMKNKIQATTNKLLNKYIQSMD